MTYAAKTEVPVEKTRAEIERTLTRYGATSFASGWGQNGAQIAFEIGGRRVRFMLPLPSRDEKRFTEFKRGYSTHRRTPEGALREWEQACRQRWRALALCIKALREAVEAGITEFDDEFMAHIVLPDGKTVREHVKPQIALAYDTGRTPPMLAPPEAKGED